ncbi:hypothetical protein Hanom_Chr01g00092791 [Helianthus anomalus]
MSLLVCKLTKSAILRIDLVKQLERWLSVPKDKGSKDDVDPSIPTKDMLQMMELERSPFEVLADPSKVLYSIDDPSDHLSDPSDQTSWAGYIYTHAV